PSGGKRWLTRRIFTARERREPTSGREPARESPPSAQDEVEPAQERATESARADGRRHGQRSCDEQLAVARPTPGLERAPLAREARQQPREGELPADPGEGPAGDDGEREPGDLVREEPRERDEERAPAVVLREEQPAVARVVEDARRRVLRPLPVADPG